LPGVDSRGRKLPKGFLKVYRSYHFAGMMNLAHQMADEKGMKLTVLSTNIEAEVIYQVEHAFQGMLMSAE
jgi:hypothetical protein